MNQFKLKFVSAVLAGILLPHVLYAGLDIVDIPVNQFIHNDNTFVETKSKNYTLVNDNNSSFSHHASNEIVITLKEGMVIPKSLIDTALKKEGEYSIKAYKHLGTLHIKSSSFSAEKMLELFKSETFKKYVKFVSLNYVYHVEQSNDTHYSKLWAIENIGQKVNNKEGLTDADMDIVEAWEKTKGDNDIVVAILDTGVDYSHTDLAENMWQGNVNHGYDFAGDDNGNNDNNPMPDTPYNEKGHYHGTHVAGIVGAEGDNNEGVSGVAQKVSIMAVKVFRPNGSGYANDILEGINYVLDQIDNGVNVVAVNASYGGGGSQNDSMNAAIKKLGEKGVVFCAAAGNEGKNIDNDPIYPASYNADNIIAIAATDQDDNLASFSNYGVNTVDVAAPGTNILSTYPEDKYAYLNGTSMATPEVAGSIALLAAKYPESTVAERKAMILDHVDVKSSLNTKVATSGRVNINEALGTIDEEPDNTAPTAKNDSATTEYNKAVMVDVLANDTDLEGDTLSIKSMTQPAHGTVTKENGKLKYTPDNNYSGTDTFNYTITDGKLEDTASVTITVKEEDNNNTDDTWYEFPDFDGFDFINGFMGNGVKVETTEGSNDETFVGKFTKDNVTTLITSYIPHTKAKLFMNNQFAIVDMHEGNMQIKIDANGLVIPRMPKVEDAVLPKNPLPTGTRVEIPKESNVKFTFTMTKNIKF